MLYLYILAVHVLTFNNTELNIIIEDKILDKTSSLFSTSSVVQMFLMYILVNLQFVIKKT